eukprot:14224-Pyramimonas_sp.AAC.1
MATAVTSAIAPLAQVMQQAMGTIPGLQIFGAPKNGAASRAPGGLAAAAADPLAALAPRAGTASSLSPSAPTPSSVHPSMLGDSPPIAAVAREYDPVEDLEQA